MKKISVKVCIGTTCFVMGASKFQDLETRIPVKWRNLVDVTCHSCLDLCKNNEYSKSPYVMIDDEVIADATIEKIMTAIEEKI